MAEYFERLNAGISLDPYVILSDHPELGPEILERLEAFVDLTSQLDQEPVLGTRILGKLGDYTLRRQIGRGGMGEKRAMAQLRMPGSAGTREAGRAEGRPEASATARRP